MTKGRERLEWKIRDYLARHLDLIESPLTLIAKEFELKSNHGAGGFVDILAKDGFGHTVVIEIKRSNQTARAALHELTKYVSLLRASQGLRQDQIRSILISTDWHELALPFSEYIQTSETPTLGLEITANFRGRVTSVRKFMPVNAADELVISRSQDVFLFRSKTARDRSIPRVARAARMSEISDCAILKADYLGRSKEVIYPFGIYFVFSSPFRAMSRKQISAYKSSHEWDNGLDEPDENFSAALHKQLGPCGDSYEIGYPEKLASIESHGWKLTIRGRYGRYDKNASVVSDATLVAQAMKSEGGAAHYLIRTVCPKYLVSWRQVAKDAKIVLLGDTYWTKSFCALLKEIAIRRPEATVSISIYNLANIVFGMAKLFSSHENYLPSMQVVVDDSDELVLYVGMLTWDGRKRTISGEDWVKKVFGSIEDFYFSQQFGETHTKEKTARGLLGISSVILEVRHAGTSHETTQVIRNVNGKLSRVARRRFKGQSIIHFALAQQEFGRSLVEAAKQTSLGWVN